MKFTGHEFQKILRVCNNDKLAKFKVENNGRNYQFWQRNSLPIELYTREVLEQKLNYIHLDPLQSHWDLASELNEYLYSSCSFYEQDKISYDWLTHYRDVM